MIVSAMRVQRIVWNDEFSIINCAFHYKLRNNHTISTFKFKTNIDIPVCVCRKMVNQKLECYLFGWCGQFFFSFSDCCCCRFVVYIYKFQFTKMDDNVFVVFLTSHLWMFLSICNFVCNYAYMICIRYTCLYVTANWNANSSWIQWCRISVVYLINGHCLRF